jgi:hypothetical protein
MIQGEHELSTAARLSVAPMMDWTRKVKYLMHIRSLLDLGDPMWA